ncbi:TPA: hypothetical protein U1C94_001063 [Streptococcus suis]|uniref:DUF6630 family protein n=1 Tax=Streptococcus suis TaxID=1307 RepID=UPI001ABDF07D|nr:hypothetical protein [Streptococcus suis]MBO4109761.1 hypothetical protein [Streptococcus suis]HEM3635303.1 hypothetical protein [Streptococcus suis]HEM3641908.1 hypothetical protein [Streptococcus suis]HEM3666485.1 hypothetical protein [Streptococcus suis]HEM3704753.1 hypothetical protein [Streptococcus suis]
MITEENLQDIFELADYLSKGDSEAYSLLREAVFATDPEVILDSLELVLEPAAFDAFLDLVGSSEKDNLWLILLYLLEARGYLFIRDWKASLADFSQGFDRLHTAKALGISLLAGNIDLHRAGPIPIWCEHINAQLAASGHVLAGVDMNSEQYYLFLIESEKLPLIQELSGRLGYRIDLGQNL